jgi:hypothetical protein
MDPLSLLFRVTYWHDILSGIVTDLIKTLPGNGSVNTSQRATMEAVSQWTNVIARCSAAFSAPMNQLVSGHLMCFCRSSQRANGLAGMRTRNMCFLWCMSVLRVYKWAEFRSWSSKLEGWVVDSVLVQFRVIWSVFCVVIPLPGYD